MKQYQFDNCKKGLFNIFNVEIKADIDKVTRIAEECINDWDNNTNHEYSFESNKTRTTKGHNIYNLKFTNLDLSTYVEIVASCDKNDVVFENLSLASFNNGFVRYNCNMDGSDHLPGLVSDWITSIALETNGSISGYYSSGEFLFPLLVVKGKDLSNRIKGLAVIDDKQRIYSDFNDYPHPSDDDDEDEFEDNSYTGKYIIKDWIDDNPKFKEKLNQTDKDEVPELMGQYAVYQKAHDMITSNQLKDIMIQLDGIVKLKGGFKDQNVETIRQMII